MLQLPCTPDILITPSDLSTFARPLPLPGEPGGLHEEIVGINPGRLAKGSSGGTFAHVQICHAVQGQDGGECKHALSQGCRVDIIRI